MSWRARNVWFRYPDSGTDAVAGADLDAGPGEMVALVGPSGAGKTTVTYLLQRFYDPESGRVLLDGHDLRDITLGSVSRAVGTVMQDTTLFHSTLADNIYSNWIPLFLFKVHGLEEPDRGFYSAMPLICSRRAAVTA